MKGIYVAIKNYEIHDGDGLRTTVFLKGCPLKCQWCHNPECISFKKEIGFYEEKCKMCGLCQMVCPNNCHTFENGVHKFNRDICNSCGKCVDVCIHNSLTKFGEEIESDELVNLLLKDYEFFINIGGGITISGGEPLSQYEFVEELAKKLKEKNVHVSIDTSLFVKEDAILKVAPYVDVFLVDVKTYYSTTHLELTGGDNTTIKNNMKLLEKLNKKMEIRIPYIPNLNSNEMTLIAKSLKNYKNIIGVKILPYHYYSKDKYHSLDLKYICEDVLKPTNKEMENVRRIFKDEGLNVIEDN